MRPGIPKAETDRHSQDEVQTAGPTGKGLHHQRRTGDYPAFLNSILFLDYDRVGFPYPVIPFQVNCYGSYVIARHGEPTRFGIAEEPSELDPPGPVPQRAMQIGAPSPGPRWRRPTGSR